MLLKKIHHKGHRGGIGLAGCREIICAGVMGLYAGIGFSNDSPQRARRTQRGG